MDKTGNMLEAIPLIVKLNELGVEQKRKRQEWHEQFVRDDEQRLKILRRLIEYGFKFTMPQSLGSYVSIEILKGQLSDLRTILGKVKQIDTSPDTNNKPNGIVVTVTVGNIENRVLTFYYRSVLSDDGKCRIESRKVEIRNVVCKT
jgi:hypothetical protein